MMNKPKIAFLIPAYGVIQLEAWQSHINLLLNWHHFCQPGFFTASSCYLHECRNRLVEMWKEADDKEKFDYVFWIDSDMKFAARDVAFLLDELKDGNYDIASGLYYNIVEGKLTPMAQDLDKKLDKYFNVPLPLDNIGTEFKVDGAGFGFVIMKAQVLRKMLGDHKRLFDYRISKKGNMIGEDNYFFELAKKSGFSLMLFPKIKLGHIKSLSL